MSTHSCPRSKTDEWPYALESRPLISVARSSPPRPSNSGVALAEQSTEKTRRPSEGLSGDGESSSA